MSSTVHNSSYGPTHQGVARVDYADSSSPTSDQDEKADTSSPASTSDDDTDTWSIFTDAHAEGKPRRLAPSRNPSSNHGNKPSKWRACMHRFTTYIRMRRTTWSDNELTHPLIDEKTTGAALVDFDGDDDPYKAINWPFRKKAITTLLYGLTTFGAAFASSIYSTAQQQIEDEFNISEEVARLGTTLLLVGFSAGPLLWAPLSELSGRKTSVLAPTFIAAMFAFGGGAAKDIQTILICRFFQGIFGSAPITCAGGVLVDMFSVEVRANATVAYGLAVLGGPTLGPVVGGAIVVSTSWRWTQYVTGIFQLVVLFFDILVLDETHPPSLLVARAKRLRLKSGNWSLHAKHEEWDVSIGEMLEKYAVRPWRLLGTPICLAVCVYGAFVYGLLYATLSAFPAQFQDIRGWNQLTGSLPFLGLLLGILIGAAGNILNQRFYVKRLRANNGRPVPEARLPPMMIGSLIFTAGLFIYAWTPETFIPWIVPLVGIVCIGIGFFTIFQACLNYLIDTFQHWSASAVAASTFTRSMLAAAFPLLVPLMVDNLGFQWAMSLFGFVAVAMIPIPFLFYIFGKRIRAKGVWSRGSV